MEAAVWECDDLRRYIFSFLRTKPTLICGQCNAVCVVGQKSAPSHLFPRPPFVRGMLGKEPSVPHRLIALWLEVVLGQVGVAIVPCNVVIHRSIKVWAQHRVHFFFHPIQKKRWTLSLTNVWCIEFNIYCNPPISEQGKPPPSKI